MNVICTTQNKVPNGEKQTESFHLFQSTLIWSVFFLVLLDLVLIFLQPIKYVQIPGIILRQQDHIDYKIQSVLSNNAFDTLLMGSSLAEAAATNADAAQGLTKPTVYSAARYNQAIYFDRLKREKLKIESTTFSTAIGGSMISDQELILQKVFAKSKLPKQVCLLIEPRAFIDATRTPDLYPVTCYMKWRYKDIWHIDALEDGVNLALSSFWNFFKFRSDFSTMLTTLANNQLKSESPSIKIALEDQDYKFDRSMDPRAVEESLVYYRKAYQKVDRQKFQAQLTSLRNIIRMCKVNNVALVLVAAPLAESNRNLLPEGFEQIYNKTLDSISDEHKIAICRLTDTDNIKESDYIDFVHLNSRGAMKFWNMVVDFIGNAHEFER